MSIESGGHWERNAASVFLLAGTALSAALRVANLDESAQLPVAFVAVSMTVRYVLQTGMVAADVRGGAQVGGLLFDLITGMAGSVGLLFVVLVDTTGWNGMTLFLGQCCFAWLALTGEMNYERSVALGAIARIGDYSPYERLGLDSFRWLYGGPPDKSRRERIYFIATAIVVLVVHPTA